MRLPPLNALRAFETAARLGSLTLAGREMHVTHGAVSQHVRSLENALGVELFVRRGNQIRLTAAGLAVYKLAHQGLESFSQIAHVVGRPDTTQGKVTISAPHGFLCHWFVHRLGEIRSRFPDIQLAVIPSNNDDEIRSGEADMCIRYGDGAWSRSNVTLLADIYLFPVCSPVLLRPPQVLEKPADLSAFPILCADDGHEWDSWLASAGVTTAMTANRHYFGDALTATEACRAGFGVALAGNISSAHYIEQGGLVRPLQHSVRVSRSLYIITDGNEGRYRDVEAIYNWFLGKLSPQRAG